MRKYNLTLIIEDMRILNAESTLLYIITESHFLPKLAGSGALKAPDDLCVGCAASTFLDK